MEASSKLKALKFMQRGAAAAPKTEEPSTTASAGTPGNKQVSEEERRLAEQRERLAGSARWHLDPPPASGPTSPAKLTIMAGFSPSVVHMSAESRRSFNMKRTEDTVPVEEADVDMEASREKEHRALAKSAEKRFQDSKLQKARQKYNSSKKKDH